MQLINLALCYEFFKVDVKKAEDAKLYLTLPATWAEVEQMEKQTGKQFHHSGAIPVTKDSFQLATLTCSTKLTQNGITEAQGSFLLDVTIGLLC